MNNLAELSHKYYPDSGQQSGDISVNDFILSY